MICCKSCGSELPSNAQFCGNCGYKVVDGNVTVTDYGNPLDLGIPERQTPPPFNKPLNSDVQDSGRGLQDRDSTLRTMWSFEDIERANAQFKHSVTDENDVVLPDFILPGMLPAQGQMPSPGQAPMVQGSPQFGGVPSVQGTPVAPGNVAQSIPDAVHGAASSAPSYAPQEAQSVPMQHQNMQYASYQKPASHYQPVHRSNPGSTTDAIKHHHPYDTGSAHAHGSHSHKLHHAGATTSKAGMSALSKWLIIIVVTLVIAGTGGVLIARALMPPTPPPALSITGSNVVRAGDVLRVHGQGFHSGDGVALTIDNGLSVYLAGQHGSQIASNGIDRNAPVTRLSQMNIAGMFQPHSPVRSNVTVSSTGTFDVDVTIPSNLPAGQHILHATDNQSSQNASLQFTVSSSQLMVNPTALQFGSVEVGRTVKLQITLSNLGSASLHWTATVEGSNTSWLTLSKTSDVLATNGANETVIVTANTNGLLVGARNATLRFHSNNGDVLVAVNIQVVSVGQSGQQAILNVSQKSLDFGQLQAGQQGQKNVSIANLGNLPLQWQASADTASAKWLSLATASGTIQQGANPQLVQVNVDSSGLAAGSYSGTVNITSNGGNAQVKVTLVVKSTPRIPTVTSINPASGSNNGGTTVTITGTGFTGATSVSFGTMAVSSFAVVSDTQITATSPAGSGTVDITVTIPVGTSTTSSADQFTYIIATALPKVTSINPTSGYTTGGTTVTITGTGFTGATSVTFGQTPASSFTVASDIQITVTSPAGSGTVDVTVTTPGGTSVTSVADQFTYTTPPPKVASINPTSGYTTGGTTVTITGTGFTGATGVSFGKTPASSFTVASDTQITATSPVGSGTVDVTVTTPVSTSATNSADQFTYLIPPPAVTSINPQGGFTTGGTIVTITGTGFTGATGVSFGKTPASSFTVVSDTQITVTSPVATSTGTVDVAVTTPGGTSTTSTHDQFTYSLPLQ